MNKKALISVLSKQSKEDKDTIEVVTPGEFYKEGECYCAVYEETEISGMEGTTTTLKIYPDKFSLIRMGTTNTSMEFQKDVDNISLYDTPYGTLELKIETTDLKIGVDENGGEIFINYNMSIAGQKPQITMLKINIKSQK